MSFEFNIVFTGLTLFCLNGSEFCDVAVWDSEKDAARVFLVNGTENRSLCGSSLPGGHWPRLAFDYEDLHEGGIAPQIVSRVHEEPGPHGERIGIVDLRELDICFEPRGGVWPHRKLGDVDKEDGFSNKWSGDEKPKWWRPDADAYDWLPHLTEVDKRAGTLRSDVYSSLAGNHYVTSRVGLPFGHVETGGLARYRKGRKKGKYIAWNTPGQDGQDDLPRALPDRVIWSLGRVRERVDVTDCQGNVFLILAPSRGGGVTVSVSNLPDHELPARHGYLDHFRWYYRLTDAAKDPDTCPSDVPYLPGIQTSTSPPALWKKKGELDLVINKTTHCPPAGSR